MCSSGARPLCCGKWNRHRWVPLTSFNQASGPDAAAAGGWACARPVANAVTPAAAPTRRARNPRRFAEDSVVVMQTPPCRSTRIYATRASGRFGLTGMFERGRDGGEDVSRAVHRLRPEPLEDPRHGILHGPL